MRGTIEIRFATEDIRDLSDKQLPVEVWVVRTFDDGRVLERLFATATKPHRVSVQVARAAGGLPFGSCKKHVELRTPRVRQAPEQEVP